MLQIILYSLILSMMFQLLGKYINLYRTMFKMKDLKDIQHPKITIIIPTYNEEKVIEKSILSIEKNSYKNYEIIVIDDNSKDNTYKILKDLENKFSNLKVFKKKGKQGKPQSLNEAFEYASGDVILFLDADAILPDDYLEKHIRYFANKNTEMIYVDFEAYNYHKKLIFDYQEIYFEFSRNILYSNIFSKAVFMGNGVFIKKDILKKIMPIDVNTLVDDVHMAIKLNEIGITQFFIIEPKTEIQYATSLKDLFFQHKRWYIGGLEEFFKASVNKRFDVFILNAFVIIMLFIPIFAVAISFKYPLLTKNILLYYFTIIWGTLLASVFLNKKIKLPGIIFNSLITIPFMIIFEYIIVFNSFISLFKKERIWYKVNRDEVK
ncbi:glycosyl transferase [Marinitoga piezophila KA3]|uniref:Glycosyl transferase n=1 Tax=Marinitoga piezophila (strain DSM 14283 / JCM 11233 / KA3) TaxID=443254 RepID=H2J4F8_MARPK|nr:MULTISPECIES: glycosyltransferase [Marinitoga]AEX84813.1 glycosyl transferase [Marinitoga piezophila KA3]